MTVQEVAVQRTWIEERKREAHEKGLTLRELLDVREARKVQDAAEKTLDELDRAREARLSAEEDARQTKLAKKRVEKALAEILAMNKAGNMAVTLTPVRPGRPADPTTLLKRWYEEGWALIAAGQHPCKTGLLQEYADLYLKILRDLSDSSIKGDKQ